MSSAVDMPFPISTAGGNFTWQQEQQHLLPLWRLPWLLP
jgi:hypothetical protein